MGVDHDNKLERQGEGSSSLNQAVKIIVFTTGGTIEKTYDEIDGSLENRESIIRQNISQSLRLPYTSLEIRPLMSKDSLYMTDEDRKLILQAVVANHLRGHPILILHGTDTMEHSARFCREGLCELKVPVVFTGAMKPIGFTDSDAIQNVTEALMAAKIVPPGVYISFHNRLYEAGRSRKNHRLKTFEEVGSV